MLDSQAHISDSGLKTQTHACLSLHVGADTVRVGKPSPGLLSATAVSCSTAGKGRRKTGGRGRSKRKGDGEGKGRKERISCKSTGEPAR